jgi:hypothetical protein
MNRATPDEIHPVTAAPLVAEHQQVDRTAGTPAARARSPRMT